MSGAECVSVVQAVIDVLSGLLTPVIAAIAVYIAYQQWQTNHRKLELDLYGGRLRVYQAVTRFLDKVLTELSPEPQDIFDLRSDTAEADFLFGPDVTEYLRQLTVRAATLRRWKGEYRDDQQTPPEGYDHAGVVEAIHRETEWFSQQPEAALKIFKQHLNLVPERRRRWWHSGRLTDRGRKALAANTCETRD